MRDASILESGFKTIGYIDIKKVKCGKKNCKCSTDLEALHGPYYYYRYWKLVYNRYRQKRLYITERQAIRIQRAIDNYREMCGEYGGAKKYKELADELLRRIQGGVNHG